MLIWRGLTKAEAEKRARKEISDDRKLRKLGYSGNYSSVKVVLTFDGPGGKEYGVDVVPISEGRMNPNYTLTEQAKKRAREIGKIVVKSSSHSMTRRLETRLSGVSWYGPVGLGSKGNLYLVDDTSENRKALE